MRYLIGLVCLLAACAPSMPAACVPGASVACACPGGVAGAQVCNAAGTALGACDCVAPMDDGADVVMADAADARLDAVTHRDAVDAPSGPIAFDLSARYDATSFVAVFTGTHPTACTGSTCDDVAFGTDGASQGVSCNVGCMVQQCGGFGGFVCDGLLLNGFVATQTPTVSLSDVSGPLRAVVVSMVTRGPMYTDGAGANRMNFHLQAHLAATASRGGMTGVAGVTASPTEGDIWLMGAPL